MRVPNIIRAAAITTGFVAAMVLAGSVSAQEISNTEWAERPGATAAVPSSTGQLRSVAAAARQEVQPARKTISHEPIGAHLAGSLAAIAVSILGVGGIVALLAWSQTKREGRNRNFEAQAIHEQRSVSL